MHWLIEALVSPAPLSESDAQRTHFEGAERRTKCSESFSLWDATCCRQAATTLGAQPRQPSRRRACPFEPSSLKYDFQRRPL